jgi:transglutaminase-like putative cysteine protease
MMSGRARLAVCAAAASIMVACSLLPLTDSSAWIVQALFLVIIQSSVGALARRVPLARPLTILAQAAASLLLLTLIFAQQQAFLGFLPGTGVFRHFGELLTTGVQDVSQFAIPAPVTMGIRLLLVGGVLLIALAVDALAVTYGSAAPAGLPLLALYSIAAGLAGGGSRWLWFVIAAAGYLLLLLAEGRDRLSRWGRVFGGPSGGSPAAGYAGGASAFSRGSGSEGSATAPVRTGRRIGAMALGIALIAPAALPSLSGGLLAATGAGNGTGRGGSILAVNPLVALTDNLNQPDNRDVLTYRTNAKNTSDLYLRIVSLDEFNGEQWQSAKRSLTGVPAQLPTPAGLSPQIKTTEVQTNVAAAKDYGQLWLPLPYPAKQVQVNGRWRYEPVGRTIIGDRGQTTSGVSYSVTSLQVEPTAAQLAAAPNPSANLVREYTAVPDSLPAVVKNTALSITKNATNEYEQAVALQNWFTNGQFTYSTSVSSGTGVDAIAKFLKNKEGFCVHFAFTMAAMARTLGIPARVAVGFTPGTPQSDGSYTVGLKDAHAWPELYFEGIGWTRFEPTPTRGSQPDYTQDPTSANSGSTTPDVPSRNSSAAPSASASASPTCSAKQAQQGDCDPLAVASGSGPKSGGLWGWLLGVTGGGVLPALLFGLVLLFLGAAVVIVPLLPLLWRRRMRARRLGQHRVLDAWRELVDTAWDYGVMPDDSETPRRAVARLIREGRLGEVPAQAARRIATAVEQALYAPRPQPVAGLAADIHHVRDGLHHSATRAARMRAALAPRSAARLAWALSLRWSATTTAWTAALHRAATAIRRPARQTR